MSKTKSRFDKTFFVSPYKGCLTILKFMTSEFFKFENVTNVKFKKKSLLSYSQTKPRLDKSSFVSPYKGCLKILKIMPS